MDGTHDDGGARLSRAVNERGGRGELVVGLSFFFLSRGEVDK